MMDKSAQLLESFVHFCQAHPEFRFWQALASWSESPFILVSEASPYDNNFDRFVVADTFYWNTRNGRASTETVSNVTKDCG
jgi:hypothetical protein